MKTVNLKKTPIRYVRTEKDILKKISHVSSGLFMAWEIQ
jgi:hypothetical protein